MSTGERVLVVRRGALGDLLLVLPLVHALRAHSPEAAIDVAGHGDHVAVLEAYGAADRAASAESLRLWAIGRPGRTGDDCRAHLARYRRIFLDDADGTPALPVTAYRPFDLLRPDATARLERLLGTPCGPLRWTLVEREPPAQGPIVLHPGSGGPRKCWPRARWTSVARRLTDLGHRVTVVRGPVERERGIAFDPALPAAVERVEPDSIVAFARLLERAAAFAGNDSGASHLAAALCVPTVAVFGPTDPAVWAPRGPRVVVVGRPTGTAPPDVDPDRVVRALSEAVAAPPNGRVSAACPT